jgi:hypothetical protein
VLVVAACPRDASPRGGAPFPCGVANPGQALQIVYPFIGFRLDDGVTCAPGTTDECADEFTLCDLRLDEVNVGELERSVVAITNPTIAPLEIAGIRIEGDCSDAYLEGPLPTFVEPEGESEVTIVINATQLGPCDAALVVESNAVNSPQDDRNISRVTIDISADRVGDASMECGSEGACCCSDRLLDAPTCVDARLVCAVGNIYFGERCEEPACEP